MVRVTSRVVRNSGNPYLALRYAVAAGNLCYRTPEMSYLKPV